MKGKALCSWCSRELTAKTICYYKGEYICRECYLNKLITNVLTSEVKEEDNTKNYKIMGECKYCHFPVHEYQQYYRRGNYEFLHMECVEKYTWKLFKCSGWKHERGSRNDSL